MTMFFLLALTLFDNPLIAPKKVIIYPYQLESESDPRTYMRGVSQIEIDNDLIYLRSHSSPEIQVFDKSKAFAFSLGKKGLGPGEFPTSIMAMAVNNGIVVGLKSRKALAFFENDQHQFDIPIPGVQFNYGHLSTNTFAFDDEVLIVQAPPRSGSLALAYRHDGTVVGKLGKIFPPNRETLMKNPAYNDTLWVDGGTHWFAAFKYHPLILSFNKSTFEPAAEFGYETAAVDEWLDRWADYEPKKRFNTPVAMVSDFKWHRGSLWVMCNGALLQINPESGALVKVSHFFGQGPDFADLPGRLFFYSFDFFSNNQVVMSGVGESWGHHLWTANFDIGGVL